MNDTDTTTDAGATTDTTGTTDTGDTTDAARLDEIMVAAVRAAKRAAAASAVERRAWLTATADALDDDADGLIGIAARESHLPLARLTGELARTTAQLRLFARVLDEGSYLEATIDHPDAAATPPIPDLRRMLVPLGVVAVFSASNFPFAFSVAGGDTASALATGNAVVVKAHPGHPELSVRTAAVVRDALRDAGAPDGLFALVTGFEVGPQLVAHPDTAAVGFTGSVPGGRALFDIASRRPSPIPFYGELGSLNPVVLTRRAVQRRAAELAEGLVGSVTLGAGQFCTKPGIVFVPAGPDADAAADAGSGPGADAGSADTVSAEPGADAASFAALVARALPSDPWTLLTPSIAEGFGRRTDEQLAVDGVEIVAGRAPTADADGTPAVVLSTTVPQLLAQQDVLLAESFGPSTLLVDYADDAELFSALAALEGSLTATLHAEPDDDLDALVGALRDRAGRLLFGGWPTGVAVSWAQHHGGPYPSTTSVHTSVGATAVRRWLRPVAYQTAPEAALPPELREGNPLGIVRRVDGVLVRD